MILGFSLAGCSNEYQSERHLYRATRLAKNVFLNPEAIPPQEFNRIVKAHEFVYETYPGTWSAKRARTSLGALYLAKKEYDKSRDTYKEVIKLYPGDNNIVIEAKFAIGKSYEEEGLWDKALLEYNKLMEEYPHTEMGFNLPMYIAKYYDKQGDTVRRNRAYDAAIARYGKISAENPDTVIGYQAENFTVMCCLEKADWERAAASLERLIMDYPRARNLALSIRMLADLSVNRLKTPERAVKLYEDFLEKYPEHAIVDALKKGLETLKDAAANE